MEAKKYGDKGGTEFYKVMSNAVYGKTMDNLRNRVDVRLVNNKKYYLKWTPKPNLAIEKLFRNDLVAIHKIKTTLTLNKLAFFELSILEFSKVPMYEFHYDHIKSKYGNKLRLFFNVYDDCSKNKEMFGFSNYSVKSKYYDDSNALVIAKMKHEMDSVAIEAFAGLKPKMYLLLVIDSSEYIKTKDVNKHVVTMNIKIFC